MFTRKIVKRTALFAIGTSVGTWSLVTTVNDEWDDVLPAKGPKHKGGKERVVILGSGWGALETVRKLSPAQEVVLISPRPHFTYTPLLAGSAVGTVNTQSVVEPIRNFLHKRVPRFQNIFWGEPENEMPKTFVQAVAEDIDVERKVVICKSLIDYNTLERKSNENNLPEKFEVSYDKLVIGVGATTASFNIPGVTDYCLFLKEVSDATAIRTRILNCLEEADSLLEEAKVAKDMNSIDANREAERLLRFVVVGGGPTGVELVSELSDFIRTDVTNKFGKELASKVKISLIEAMPRILGPFDPEISTYATEHLEESGVEIKTGYQIKKIDSRQSATVKTPAGDIEKLEFGAIVWAAGIATRPITLKIAERLGQFKPAKGVRPPRGIAVDKQLKVVSDNEEKTSGIYALGDAAVSGYPPTAQVAAQQGKYLGRKLRNAFNESSSEITSNELANKAPEFKYNHNGSMAFIGRGAAIAQLPGPPLQRPKLNYVWRSLHAADSVDEEAEKAKPQFLTGGTAFLFWRSVYFTKLLSGSNRANIVGDWIKTEVFGRDVVQRDVPIMPRSYESS